MVVRNHIKNKILIWTIVLNIMLFPVFAYADDISSNSSIRSVDNTLTLKSVNVSSERITANDANGFKAVMLDLIGDYETIITDYTYQSTQGYTTHSISIERDYTWIFTCIMFIVVIWCTFKAVGGILCK